MTAESSVPAGETICSRIRGRMKKGKGWQSKGGWNVRSGGGNYRPGKARVEVREAKWALTTGLSLERGVGSA